MEAIPDVLTLAAFAGLVVAVAAGRAPHF